MFAAYVLRGNSQLTFWHGIPEVNEQAPLDRLGQYYMPFAYKAFYPGPFDDQGVPLLDYRGKIGKQYNPIAVAQYGLGHYNFYRRTGEQEHREIFLRQADWLVEHLELNPWGIPVWNHHFDWEYREVLLAPWYMGLAQGAGISAVARAYQETEENRYLDTAEQAFEAFRYELKDGGVRYTDEAQGVWLEEAIVDPPTHILNGFMWALWGVYDYILLTGDPEARSLYERCVHTLSHNLHRFDLGFWSLYELSGTRLKMVASPFYHRLHVVQLQVMHRLTGEPVFQQYAQRWEKYQRKRLNRALSLVYKSLFKLLYY